MRGGGVEKVGEAGEDSGGVLKRITESAAVDISEQRGGVSRFRPYLAVSSKEALERRKGGSFYISQQDEAEARALGKCRSTVLKEERVEYGILYFEIKGSDVETNWSAMLQIAEAGETMRDAIA